MDDDNGLCCFGTALDPIEEGVVSAKRITLADQIAVDSNGRRRFHGAFTGGFSAGFWNTVGSQEGWTPSEFKSSRHEKASHRAQLPSDFMDDEDTGEYGIAPQRIQTTDDFTESNKRSKRKADNSLGPIPGVPVLELVLESCRDKAAIRLLKRMDSKYAKKLMHRTKEPKNVAVEVIDEEVKQSDNIEGNDDKESDGDKDEQQTKVYQCDLGPLQRINRSENSSDSDSDIEFDQLISDCGEFANVLDNTKTNRFGLDYSGLEKGNFFTIMGAEAPQRASGSNALSKFTITDKNNKKVTINGQAFGVGAFEEDDDDIYDRDDMSKYDFRLENKKESGKTKQIMPNANHFIDGFIDVTNKSIRNKRVFKIHLPFKFEPRNWQIRKTRFGPQVVVPERVVVGRHDLAPSERGNILNETDPTKSTKEQMLGLSIDEKLKAARMKVVEFASSSKTILIDGEEIEREAIVETTFSQTKTENFKVPESLPLICDRFTSAGDVSESKKPPAVEEIVEKSKPLKEIQKVIRTKSKWLPSQLLCYKMNIESAVGAKPDKPNAFSLFECINIPGEKRRKKEMEFTGSKHGEEKESELKTNNVSKVPRIELINAKEKQPLNDSSPAVVASDGKDQTNKVQETMKPPKATIRKPLKPKTELEQKILETQDEHPSKKKDLFKAIFDSDSEGDNDDDGNENGEMSESGNKSEPILQFKAQLSTITAADAIYSSIPDDAFMPKSAKEINVLRNTSPPRGIFKSLAEIDPLRKLKVTTDTNNDTECESTPNPDWYGPSLPPKDARSDIVPAITKTNPVTISSSESSDEWIERTSSSKKKKKSSKKHKTEKHKKKKSKKSKRRHS